MRQSAWLPCVLTCLAVSVVASADDPPAGTPPVPEVIEIPPPATPPPTAAPPPAPAPVPVAQPPTYGYPYYGYAYGPPPRPRRTWYGWQTLLLDGVAFSLLYAAGQSRGSDGDKFGYPSIAVFTLGPPIVHFAHGNVGSGVGSLAIRGGSCILVAVAINGHGDSAMLGLLGFLGILAAPAIDAAVFSYETPEPKAATTKPTFTASPWVTKSGAGFGVGASF